MFNIRLTIVKPWHKNDFKYIWMKDGNISKNKAWSIEICKDSFDLFLFDLDFSWRGCDHAGPSLLLGLLSYFIHVKMYDKRHWNYDTNDWQDITECEKIWN